MDISSRKESTYYSSHSFVLLLCSKNDRRIPVDQLQQLMGDCGEAMNIFLIEEMMMYDKTHQWAMQSLKT